MGNRIPSLLALLLAACSTAQERDQAQLMDVIESRVSLPEGTSAIGNYARYYTFDGALVRAVYLIPFGDEVRPERTDDLKAGQRRWVEEKSLPMVFDGGCSVVNVLFDPSSSANILVFCNGDA